MGSSSKSVSSNTAYWKVCISTAGLVKCLGALILISHSLYQFFSEDRIDGCPNREKRKNGQNLSFIK